MKLTLEGADLLLLRESSKELDAMNELLGLCTLLVPPYLVWLEARVNYSSDSTLKAEVF